MKLKIIYAFILLSSGLHAQNLCSLCEQLKNNVVQITTGFENGKEENGFGTVIGERDNKLYILTAKHVISDLDEHGLVSPDNKTKSVTIKFFSDQGKDYAATLLKLPNTSLDIGLLEVAAPPNYTWSKNFYSIAIAKNTKVWFIGRSGRWYIPTGSFVGSINEVSPDDEIIIDINSIQPGTSGAPLISADGVVGLIFEDASSGARAYAIEKIRKLITKVWNYPWQMNLNNNITQPAGPEGEDKAWVEITGEKKEKNKISKLEDYVSKGQGAHLEDAKKMFEGLLWANISSYKNMEKYVQHFPNGLYIQQVEDKVYKDARPELYLSLFPNGKYVKEANEKEENKLWAEIKDGWDMSVDEYLKKFPHGKYISDVEEVVWQQALKGETEIAFKEQGFEKYLKHFPTGKYAVKAREKIKKYKS